MKVRELQNKLSTLSPDLEVFCYTEDSSLVANNRKFLLFDIEAITITQGERIRTEDGIPYLKLGKELSSEALVILEVTSDF
jgi:hypothetical protein